VLYVNLTISNYDIVTFTYNSPIYLHMTTMILSHSHMTSIYLPMSTMALSHSHITLQFTFIWQLWYCHIYIWLQFTFIWQLCYCHIHIWLSNLPSYNNYDIVIFTYYSPFGKLESYMWMWQYHSCHMKVN
jgi:hypothetical protein